MAPVTAFRASPPQWVTLARRSNSSACVYIAGMLHNNPDNLIKWLRNPQSVTPGNAMPDMHVTEQDARDIAAYLYAPAGTEW